jgi:hypothetical protein
MSTILTAPGLVAQGDLTSNTATAQTTVGERIVSADGRAYVYARAGAVALVPGTLLQSAAEITDHQNVVPTATFSPPTNPTIPSTVTVTLGATAVTANYYAGGYMIVTETPGQGYQYLILSHPAADASATCTFTLADPIQVAVTTSSHIDLVPNPYAGVIINPTTATSAPVGAAIYPITALYYGWIQVAGPTTLLADGTVTVGTAVVASNGTAGAVEALTGVQAPVGLALTGIATTEYGAIKLNLG